MSAVKGVDVLDRLWQAVSGADVALARAVVSEQIDAGVSGHALVAGLLVPIQRRVGQQWQEARWSIADEHAATAAVDAAFAVIELSARAPDPYGPLVAVVCAETEWHVLPARLAAFRAGERGARVRFLGGSLPADHLREYVVRLQPDVVVVSATVATALPGAARSIAAVRSVGVPVIAGGAAFGTDPNRAAVLQASCWAADAGELPQLIAEPTQLPAGTPRWREHDELLAQSSSAASGAYTWLLAQSPHLRNMNAAQMARTREDLRYTIEFVAAAILVDDPRIFSEYSAWMRSVLEPRHVTPAAVHASYLALAAHVDGEGKELLLQAADALSGVA